ncbi:UDP-N-acetylmuramate--L-alanine ligase [Gloeocapsa sp. PCC 73106]|uniref:UDP-N-acetylmuramate--L-alanine ligase n=1 Tax=Gloeocapsa sp. PCC 73106 TaxID=102232 RepID=UPI0002AB9FC2|nr:UDP-N-acetylmuramate--L-alanine ligase [Gloeocapsa sp. PCC 73106]ELR98918.1 UDP-N-acetylmuramate--L-alanine ligase [Gloeocapsa sp. PCC 73106]
MKTIDLSGQPFHFIGIGGIGMSGLAYVLAKRRFRVSGSDIRPNHITERLQSVGAHIFTQQQASNLQIFKQSSLPQIIWSTAINNHNCEYKAAISHGFPLFHRSELLAALISDYYSIAVSGTHGKTTTSSLLGYLLLEAGLDPTIIVGGEVNAWEGNARLGEGKFLVAEADESDGSLTKHTPKIGVITNIELDHPDHYQSLQQLISTFQTFARQCELVVGCLDCETVREYIKPDIGYTLMDRPEADYWAQNIKYQGKESEAQIWERGEYLGKIRLQIPGQHNISNALAAIAVGRKLGLAFETISDALAGFSGAKRRFEIRGEYRGAILVDDYAHHPSEVEATLKAARVQAEQGCYQRIVAIFQPHRYTRTQTFLAEFATAFRDADQVIITDIYGAGETNPNHLSGAQVAQAIEAHHPGGVVYHPEVQSLSSYLSKILQKGDLALFLGAGNLNQVIPELIFS